MRVTRETTPAAAAETPQRREYRAPRVVLRDKIDVLCGLCDSLWGNAGAGCRTPGPGICSGKATTD